MFSNHRSQSLPFQGEKLSFWKTEIIRSMKSLLHPAGLELMSVLLRYPVWTSQPTQAAVIKRPSTG